MAFTLGGLLGRDTTRDTLKPLFTAGTAVIYPAAAMRVGGRSFGVEGGTLLLDDPADRPYAGFYFGAPTFRLRTGISWASVGGPVPTPAFTASLRVRAKPAWLQLQVSGGAGAEVTGRVGFDLP